MSRWPARLAPPVCPADNLARAFWQSRTGERDPPQLADLPALARAVRASWPTTTAEPAPTGAQEGANEMVRPVLRFVRTASDNA